MMQQLMELTNPILCDLQKEAKELYPDHALDVQKLLNAIRSELVSRAVKLPHKSKTITFDNVVDCPVKFHSIKMSPPLTGKEARKNMKGKFPPNPRCTYRFLQVDSFPVGHYLLLGIAKETDPYHDNDLQLFPFNPLHKGEWTIGVNIDVRLFDAISLLPLGLLYLNQEASQERNAVIEYDNRMEFDGFVLISLNKN